MHSSIALVALMAAGSAVAKIVQINVGKGGFVFSPDTTTADVGDTLEFHFFASFHTAVQGDFNTPCQRGSLESTGFNSGPIKNNADGTPSVFQVTVKDTNPIWFYCSTPSHCQSGMAGVVNPPSSGNTLATYKSNAAGTSSSEGSSTVSGGQVVAVGTQPSGASGSSSGAPASSSSAPPSSSAASVASSASSASSVASSAGSSAASGASSGTSSAAGTGTTSAGTGTGTATTAAAGSSTSAKASTSPTTVSSSGASAQGVFAGLVAVGLGMCVWLMA